MWRSWQEQSSTNWKIGGSTPSTCRVLGMQLSKQPPPSTLKYVIEHIPISSEHYKKVAYCSLNIILEFLVLSQSNVSHFITPIIHFFEWERFKKKM